jgi:hypothetical protein
MADWNTRLAVTYTDEDKNTVSISPIDTFTPTFSLNAEVLHSIEATHIGVVYSPQAISFSMSVKAIGPVAAQLTSLALEGKRFEIVLQESEGGSDWAFKKLIMKDCIITSATPTTATISGAPSATFSGFSLAASSEPKTGKTVEIP